MARSKETVDIDSVVAQIRSSKKYRAMDICEDTIRDLLITELGRRKKRDAIHAVKEKLHHIVAPYLGEPDYAAALDELRLAFESRQEGAVKETCARVMGAHASMRERLAILDGFYTRIFAVTGAPAALLDVACGLHPLSFAWMGLPVSTRYHAYDLNRRRVDFLNQFFSLQGSAGRAHAQDILLDVPQEEADVAFILKEVHRFERRQRGSSLPLLDTLRVRHLVISFPTKNLTGRHNLTNIYRQFLQNIIGHRPWPVSEIEFESELVFCLDKGGRSRGPPRSVEP